MSGLMICLLTISVVSKENTTAEGANVELDITEGRHHGWQAMADASNSGSYFASGPERKHFGGYVCRK